MDSHPVDSPPDEGDWKMNAAYRLLAAKTWDALHSLLEHEHSLLLSDAVVELLAVGLESARAESDEDAVAVLEPLYKLLCQYREIGIEPAMYAFGMPLKETEADPRAVLQAHGDFLQAHFKWGNGRAGRAVRAVLEREQDLLLTDTADRVLKFMDERFRKTDDFNEKCRILLRRARQVGIDKAWREYIQLTQGKDWTWVELFEVFEEWVSESLFGEGYSFSKPRQGRAILEGYRQGCHFLEAHHELLNPLFFEEPLTVEIRDAENKTSAWKKDLEPGRYFDPSTEGTILPPPAAPQYWNSEVRMLGLIEGQELLRDAYERGGTDQAIREAYVNAYGGFVLELPPWIEEVLRQVDTLRQQSSLAQTVEARATLLQDAYNRAYSDSSLPMEIVIEPIYEWARAFAENPESGIYLDNRWIDSYDVQITTYGDCLEVYTRERYPAQWAKIQYALADTYRKRVAGNKEDNLEQAIQCYEMALQGITRNVSYASWDRTEHNATWALLQVALGDAYAKRTKGERTTNLTRAVACYKAALLVHTPEFTPATHIINQLLLAFLYFQQWVPEAAQRADALGVQNAYQLAHEAFAAARKTRRELSWQEYTLRDRARHELVWHGAGTMYASDAWCLQQLGNLRAAVVALEDGRAQALAQAQAVAGATLVGVCEFHMQKFSEVRQEWDKAHVKGTPDAIGDARRNFLQLRQAIRDHCKPDFLPDEPDYLSIAYAAPDQALVYLAATEKGGIAFVVPPIQHASEKSLHPHTIMLPKLTVPQIDTWLVRFDRQSDQIVGGYQFAIQHRCLELLEYWIQSDNDIEAREQRLATRLADLPQVIHPSFATLRNAFHKLISAWSIRADGYWDKLSWPLQKALDKRIFDEELNWFLQEAELEYLLDDLSTTFVRDLYHSIVRLGLGAPDQAIALIPCGKLGILPIHAAWAKKDPYTSALIPWQETCELSYQASARSLADAKATLKALPRGGPVVAVGDPQPTGGEKLPWAAAEAENIVELSRFLGREAHRALTGKAATREAVLEAIEQQNTMRSGAWVHLATHGHADPLSPERCFMLLAHNKRISLAEFQRQSLLRGVRGFNASGCVTGLGSIETAPDELGSFASGILQAGAPCAVATLWSVSDRAEFWLMLRFMSELLRAPDVSPARALREASRWLRQVSREELQELAMTGVEGFRFLSAEEDGIREAVRGVLEEEVLFVEILFVLSG